MISIDTETFILEHRGLSARRVAMEAGCSPGTVWRVWKKGGIRERGLAGGSKKKPQRTAKLPPTRKEIRERCDAILRARGINPKENYDGC